jgi:regulatory protein
VIKNNKDIKKYALFLLKYKSYFSFEISKKLIKKGYNLEDIDILINNLKESLLINDDEKFRYLIENMQKIKKFGKIRIKYELLKKGANINLVNEMINKYYLKDIEEKIINELIESKKQELINEDKLKIKQKTYIFLKRKGF